MSPDYSNALHVAADNEFPAPTAPMEVARRIYQQYRRGNDRTLVTWRGEWMNWTGTDWKEVEHTDLRGQVYELLEHKTYLAMVDRKTERWELVPFNPNRHKVADVMEALQAIAHLDGHLEAPAWIPSNTPAVQAVPDNSKTIALPPPEEVISCRNGLLHVPTRMMLDHTPQFFTRTSVPFDYDATAPEPVAWKRFLEQVWGNDRQAIEALQEYLGYVLSGRTDQQKILLLIGPTRSGKGTIARVLAALVGAGNVAGPTLASLGTNFGLAPLLGKPLAVVSDARLGGTNVHQVVERLLSISGEDLLTVDRKFKEPWSGKLGARFVILSNELPRFGDASGAIANRFLVLSMTASFLGKEDRSLTGRLLAELPGILSWALDGLDRLTKRGFFTTPPSSTAAVTLLQDLVSPISAFVRNECIQGTGEMIVKSELYEAWKRWCEENGHHPTASGTFGRDLRSVIPTLGDVRPRAGGARFRSYSGLRLRTAGDDDGDLDPWSEPSTKPLNGVSPGPPGPPQETAGHSDAVELSTSGQVGPPDTAEPDRSRQGVDECTPNLQVTAGGPGGPGQTPFKPLVQDEPVPPQTCEICDQALLFPTSDAAICDLKDTEHDEARTAHKHAHRAAIKDDDHA
ncbi:hypothetical protein RQCS_11970 [Rhodococcus qingshengii]|uniref:DNA primase family protein n=1 Tax=Rhodococcus qingshengii TaxID=334542 RepID=UPI0007E575A9|nr:phage/plasmid primase, P4 family [Rhodococcus qingshengii]BCF81652.1 hypothetical protein RQCS_11970 [Rhodococcus qingshengii]